MTPLVLDRGGLVRRGCELERLTIAYNLLESAVALISGLFAGSIALLGFGMDSLIEVTSAGVLLWRLSGDEDEARRERLEGQALRAVGVCFLALAAYVGWESATALLGREAPEKSLPGIALAAASLIVMPLLARAKRRVAAALGSAALTADAKQTDLCFYLSGILLGGLGLNALFGWWWADPLAGLVMLPIIVKEGLDAVRGKTRCACGPGC
jgi:divalent metal cation (Fe/Co/Zn/Cd) transporter